MSLPSLNKVIIIIIIMIEDFDLKALTSVNLNSLSPASALLFGGFENNPQ